ncbi:MAG: hypothetical protein KAH18_05995 [Psychromonas sp.]|nr:hypothetical protein [Psychromonas sp.]
MNKNKQIFELYIDHLVTTLSDPTATSLSNRLDGNNSHDDITRFFSHKPFASVDLWANVKKEVVKLNLMIPF